MDDIECQSPHEKFMLMMLERIERIEDQVHEQNKQLQHLLSLTTSRYFSFYINGCVINDKRSPVNLIIHEIANIIHEVIPLTTMYGRYYFENTGCCVCLETQSPWLLKTIQETLDKELRNAMPRTIVNSWDMHIKVPSNFEKVVTLIDNKFVPMYQEG
jgi:hypothetical protein